MEFLISFATLVGYFVSIALVYSLAEKTLKNRADTFVRVIPVVIYMLLTSYFLNQLTGSKVIYGSIAFIAGIHLLYLIALTTVYKHLRPDKYAKLVEKNSIY
ncbi:amino acid transporter [Chryseomicrobium aureum]|uniref:hypothetical protein n=1 Tax=Chryseomicrobium aureum TaxID=1441723 RepID=UPI00195CD099|nr:hypothetical protein [Chryseomicrobium aureum]MBM7706038.1 amino acid transporter [Chryseomicrobium aureum]